MSKVKEIGTLVVVVLKARNLKDSHTFYKQDPYTLIRYSGSEKQTNVDPRGGQHPVWDEELHFQVFQEVPGVDTRILKVSAYSKERRVDELLGEGQVDVSDTLRKGEFDDWVKLEMDGKYAGEVYLEMTFYSAAPPLARRASKLSPKDRLWRPPATPPKDKTSPNVTPQRSPYLTPSIPGDIPAHLRPSASPRRDHQPLPGLPPTIQEDIPFASVPGSKSPMSQTLPSQPTHSQPMISPRKEEPPLPPIPTPPRQPSADPTLRNIPFLDVGPSAANTQGSSRSAQSLHAVPSILRPRNVKSSPIPVHTGAPPSLPPRHGYDDPEKRFQQQLAESDAAYAARLAEMEGIDLERLRQEEADAEFARRLAQEEEEVRGERGNENSIPGGWIS